MNTNIPVEQLWYTWSDVGLGSMHAGLRIRAASAGLTEIYSPRMQSVDRYMHYDLPSGTDPFAVTPEMTPVGLAFIRTDQNEYILVHKNYSGKDGVGRPGNFFVHVLALGKYSDYFSAEDAIWLWDAPLWKTNDQSLDRRSTALETIPSADLDSNPRFRPQYAQVRDALAFVIEAYLTRKGRTPIYIAAPAHQAVLIAYVIAGLTGCLPRRLLADLTFSTYEPDIAKATTDIVGTSWIVAPGHAGDASQVLPEQWFRDHLAINCATGMPSRLMGHPQIDTNPLAPHFAAYAAECLATDAMQELEELCERAENSQTLTVGMFLQRYHDEIANADNIGEVEIERSLNNPDLCLDRLNSQKFRKPIIDCVLKNPSWGENRLAPILSRLRDQAGRASVSPARVSTYAAPIHEPQAVRSLIGPQKSSTRKKASAQTKKPGLSLAEALAKLAERAIQEIAPLMRQAANAQKAGTSSSSEPPLERQQISALITVMESCLTTQGSSEVWQALFNTIIKSPNATDYLRTQRDIRFRLLRHWNNALPDTEEYNSAVRPLINIPWVNFGKFLHASLSGRHKQWLFFAVEGALTDSSLNPEIAKDLTQNFSKEIYTLLSQFLQDNNSSIATDLLVKLVKQGYKLGPQMSTLVEQLLTLLNRDGLWQYAKGLVEALTRAKYVGLASYQSQVEALLGNLLTIAPAEGNALLDLLIEKGYPRKKALLDLLLATGRGRADMERSIERVYRTPEEQNAFFLHDAAPLLKQRDTAQAMVSLYEELLRAFPQDGKMARLFVLLEGSLDERTILSLLNNSSLRGNEWVQLLNQFGSHYFTVTVVRQAPQLAQHLLGRFSELIQKQYANGADLLFPILDPHIDPNYLKRLLEYANLTAVDQISFLDKHGANYLSPARLSIPMEYISTYASYFTADDLDRPEKQPFFTKLMQYHPQLPLDEKPRELIQSWQTIVNYLAASSTHPDMLSNLTKALFTLNLPSNVRFTGRLAQAFVRCIRTVDDLSHIMTPMRELQKFQKLEDGRNVTCDEIQLLYSIAERAATYYSQQTTDSLLPYLLFALAWPVQYRPKHFRHEFLDTLLRYVQETDLATWSKLHEIVMQQGLPPDAVERWKFYLDRLGLLDQISTTEETTSSTTAPSQSFWPSWPGKRNKQQAAPPVPTSHEAAAPEDPEQRSPSAQKGLLPHKQPKAINMRGSRPDANFSQGGTEFHVQGADSKQKRKK